MPCTLIQHKYSFNFNSNYFSSTQIFIQFQLKLFFFNTNIHSTSTQTIFIQQKNIQSTSTQTILLQYKYSHIISAVHHFSNIFVGKPFVASLNVGCFFRPIFTSPVGNSCILRTIISSWLL